MTKVMAFGTFDILHPGHLFFLREAKKLGTELVAVIGRDTTVNRLKAKTPRHSEQERLKALSAYQVADRVLLGSLTDPYEVIRNEQPDIIALGYDQKFFIDELSKNLPLNTKIVRIPSFKPNIYKSSKLGEL